MIAVFFVRKIWPHFQQNRNSRMRSIFCCHHLMNSSFQNLESYQKKYEKYSVYFKQISWSLANMNICISIDTLSIIRIQGYLTSQMPFFYNSYFLTIKTPHIPVNLVWHPFHSSLNRLLSPNSTFSGPWNPDRWNVFYSEIRATRNTIFLTL